MTYFLSLFFFPNYPIGDNNTSSKVNSSSTDNANTSSEDSNAAASTGNTTTTSSEGNVKFIEAPLPKVNAWKVSDWKYFAFFFSFFFFYFIWCAQLLKVWRNQYIWILFANMKLSTVGKDTAVGKDVIEKFMAVCLIEYLISAIAVWTSLND